MDNDDSEELSEYGLIDDCALFPGVFDYACRIAGASIQVEREGTYIT